MEDSLNSIVEERVELMVSPGDKNPKLRTAHFISPSKGSGSIDETQIGNLPRHCLSSLPANFAPRKWPIEVRFCGWRYPQRDWKTWVVKMSCLHESTWKKAGIFGAIMNSTYKIERNNDLVFGVAEKWCHETKSFIFSWGEETITLEDVMILGGYSVLGSPVFSPVETGEMKETCERLNNARKEIYKTASKKACHNVWMRSFMHSDSEIEHEAFLALWLSRFVLPSRFDVVVESVFPIAIRLARGNRIALAPAVLAKIYRDLSWLKQNIVASTQLESNCDDEIVALEISLWSPLTLVQVWIWERFSDMRPKPNLIENGEPRLALWHGLKYKLQDVRSVLDSTKARFEWRPYVRKVKNSDGAKFYGERSLWISIDSSSGDELLSFARCLRASELVGLDCIEQYLPHRVALQFGLDQDIPIRVSRSNDSPEIAWSEYNKSAGGGKLYIPPRLFEGDVTIRYSDWWQQSVLILQEASKYLLEKQRSFTNFKITPKRTMGMNESDVFNSFKMIPKSLKRPAEDDDCIGFRTTSKNFKGMREGTSALTRSDFYLKSLKRSRLVLKRKEKGDNATSGLGSPLKGLKLLAQYPKWKKDVCNAGFVAGSSERKKESENESMPHEFPPKSSEGPALGSKVNNEGKIEITSSSSLSMPSVNGGKLIVTVPSGFSPKCNVLEAKSSRNEDEVTPIIPPGFCSKCMDENKVALLGPPPGFPPKCNMVVVKGSVDEDRVTPIIVHGISPDNPLELGDSVEDNLTVTIARSGSNHGSMENKLGTNHEKSASHPGSLSLDSDDEDQLTIAEMLKSNNKLDNIDCRDTGKNSSGQCKSFSCSVADNEPPSCEPITTLEAEKVMPADVASEGSKAAIIQNAIESNAGRPADKMVGDNGSSAGINDNEGYGNSCLNEIARLHLEERISRLERLVAEIKAGRTARSLAIALVNLD